MGSFSLVLITSDKKEQDEREMHPTAQRWGSTCPPFMKSSKKAHIFSSFAILISNWAFGNTGRSFGGFLHHVLNSVLHTTPTRWLKQASSGLLASIQMQVHAVDGGEFITTQKLLKSEPCKEGSGSHILSKCWKNKLCVLTNLSSRLDKLSRIETFVLWRVCFLHLTETVLPFIFPQRTTQALIIGQLAPSKYTCREFCGAKIDGWNSSLLWLWHGSGPLLLYRPHCLWWLETSDHHCWRGWVSGSVTFGGCEGDLEGAHRHRFDGNGDLCTWSVDSWGGLASSPSLLPALLLHGAHSRLTP